MQTAPRPADYELLRDGVVAALQILHLEVDLLMRLKSTRETNKSLPECTFTTAASLLTIEIGEHSCRHLQSISYCNHEFSLCWHRMENSVFCIPVQSQHHMIACCSACRLKFHSHAHLPSHSVTQTYVYSSSHVQVLPCTHISAPCQTVLCHPMQG